MKKNSKKEKINPIMKEQKITKKLRNNYIEEDDENVLKRFIIIAIIIAVIVAIVYGVTELFKDKETKDELVNGSINYNKVTVGTILNRPYNEYYVLVYNAEDNDAVLYSTIMTKYMQNSKEGNYIKIYYCDLSNTLNSKYYNVGNDNKSNTSVNNTEDFDFGDLTLLKIKNGKITKYIESLEEIKELLK